MNEGKQSILIVDDDKFLLDMYALKFSQNNFEVYTAANGKEGIEKLQGGLNPKIILLDIIMPDMDGFEMLAKIKELHLSPNSIKIVLSNNGQQSDIEKCKNLGAVGYIVKASSTPMEVIEEVKGILEKNLTYKNGL